MNCIKSIVGDIRTSRKLFLNAGSFLLILLLLTTESASRPPDEADQKTSLENHFSKSDNIEFHHVKIKDGVVEKKHPIIMYKEDFVNENFVPKEKKNSMENKPIYASKKYKDMSKYRRFKNEELRKNSEDDFLIKQEKVYFDHLPEEPVDLSDDDYKDLDTSNIETELIPLVDEGEMEKSEKSHSRVRRNAEEKEHKVTKRNPFYRHYYTYQNDFNMNYLPPQYTQRQAQLPPTQFFRHVVPGNKQPVRVLIVPTIDNRFLFPKVEDYDNIDRNAFGIAQNPFVRPTERPTNAPRPNVNVRPTESSNRPERPILDLSHDSDPANADFSGFTSTTPRPMQQFTTTRPTNLQTAPPERFPSAAEESAPAPSRSGIPNCVWAIANCCTDSKSIRYNCFENYGCTGAFWDLNPCADNIRRRVINYVNDYYDDQ